MLLSSKQRLAIIGAGATIFVASAIWFAYRHWGNVYDDAFIYLRYVRNLDNGCGLRFNCHGDPVEGFTSPLYLSLLWLARQLSAHLIDLCQIVGTTALACTGIVAVATAFELGRSRDNRTAALLCIACALVLALDPFLLLNANNGLETSTAALTCTLVAYAAITKRSSMLVVCAITAFLARPEGLLLIVALPVVPELRRVRYLVPAFAAIAMVTLARLLVFDAFLPNTYYAKSGGSWRHAVLGMEYLLQIIRDFPLTLLAPLALLGPHRRTAGYLLAVSAGWAVFFLRSGGDTFEYSRLWAPLVPALTALALAGIHELAHGRLCRSAMPVTILVAILTASRATVAHAIPAQGTSSRIVEWAAVGSYLRAHYPRGSLIATVPIGAIGYYSSLPILDLVGLTDPVIAHAGRNVPVARLDKRWIGHERHDTEYVLSREPVVIVTTMRRETAWTSLAEAKTGFWADWLLLQEIKEGRAPYHVVDAEVLPGTHFLLFERDRK